MILGEKIIKYRKKNGLSQEDLALEIGVSRQSISKWENRTSIPDLDKILKLSQLFEVSTDYLLRDHMEEDIGDVDFLDEEGDSLTKLSLQEANDFMELSEKMSKKFAFGIALCIVSAIPLLMLIGFEEKIGENMAVGIGLVTLLILVALGVAIIIFSSQRIQKYDYLEKKFGLRIWGSWNCGEEEGNL